MTICNMTIEGGGRAGMIAPDETTFEWVEGRPGAPEDFDAAVERVARAAHRRRAPSFDAEVEIDAASLSPMVTWGTTPGHGRRGRPVPDPVPRGPVDRDRRSARSRYMALEPGHADAARSRSTASSSAPAPTRGSSDLREAASMVEGRRVAEHGRARWSSPAPSR